MRRSSFVSLAILLTLSWSFRAAADERPNIVFIMADDLGYADVGCFGAEKIKTPNIDRLAEEGIRFTDGHAGASTCTPTRYGFMTGRYNFRGWLKYSALSTSAPLLIEPGRVTVPSFLKSKGYQTSLVGKWHLGYGREDGFEKDRGDKPSNYWETRGKGPDWNGELRPGPQENGFDYSYVIPVANSFPPYVIVENDRVEGLREDSPIGRLESKNFGKMEGGKGARWTDEELIDKFADKLVSELDRLAAEENPFFLCYTPSHPHIGSRSARGQQHWPHERFAGTSGAGAFGDTIHELDWSVGVILESLERLGIADDTLIIFTSDNGGYPRKFNDHYPMGPVLRGGKGALVEGGTRVPFVARWPGRIRPGTVSTETVTTIDMMATFAAIVGEDLPEGAGSDSYNILPALLGERLPDPERPIIFTSGGTGALAIRAGKWKLIDGQGNCGYGELRHKKPWPTPEPGAPPAQLYKLDEDLGEANNLYLDHLDVVHRLKVGLDKIVADEAFNPTALEQPEGARLPVAQVNALFRDAGAPRSDPKPAAPESKSLATLSRIGGKVAAVSSFQPGMEAQRMLDGDPSTFWHTRFAGGDAKPPHSVVLQVPAGTRVRGLEYTAWTGGNGNGHVKRFTVSLSDDGESWGDPVLKGKLKPHARGVQTVSFSEPSSKPYIKFEITTAHSPPGRFLAAIGELDVVLAGGR